MPVQLGLADGNIPPSDTTSWTVNKLGGKPDWLVEGCTVPACDGCHSKMYLVLQIYCPLKNSPYHRVLYIFTCVSHPCWGTPHSWTVLRCQKLDVASVDRPSETKMADIGGEAGDGGSQKGGDQWCDDADDWGDENTDDVMQEQRVQTDTASTTNNALGDSPPKPHDSLSEKLHSIDLTASLSDMRRNETQDNFSSHRIKTDKMSVTLSDPLICKSRDTSSNQRGHNCMTFTPGDSAVSGTQSDLANLEIQSESMATTLGDSSVTEARDIFTDGKIHSDDTTDINSCSFKTMNIHEVDDSPTEMTSGNVIMGDDFPTSEESVNNMLSILATGSDQTQPSLTIGQLSDYLLPYYLCVIEEPVGEEVDSHVTRLLKEYVQKTGDNVCLDGDEEFPDHKSRRGAGSGGCGEKYERSEVKHGDKLFHRFLKRLTVCPHQLVRYDLHGTPLLVSNPPHGMEVPSCGSCGGPMSFELQLVPSLISLLRIPGCHDVVTEFGTVLVYTCRRSCWSDEVKVRQEVAVVQPDPDQHLFKVF